MKRYNILNVVGDGRFGTVFKAIDLETNDVVE
jgi:serine/threonine protein kinase